MVCSLVSICFDGAQLGIQQNKIYKTLEYRSRDMLNFELFEKSLEIVSPSHFVYDFSRKIFLTLYISLTDQILLPDCLFCSSYWTIFISIVCFPGCDVIIFETKLIFLIKPFFYMTEKSRQKLKYVDNEKNF